MLSRAVARPSRAVRTLEVDERTASSLDRLGPKIETARGKVHDAMANYNEKRDACVAAKAAGNLTESMKAAAEASITELSAAESALDALESQRHSIWQRVSPGGSSGNGPSGGDWLGSAIQATMNTGDSGIGEALAPAEQAGYFFDLMSPLSIALASGIGVVDTGAEKVIVPRLTSDPVAEFRAEGDELPLSDPDGDSIEVELRKIGAVTTMTREEAESSQPQALAIAESTLLRGVGNGLDLSFFEGSGNAPEIQGMKNTPDVQSIDFNQDIEDLDVFADALTLLESASVPGNYVFAMHPSNFGVLRKLKDNQDRPLLIEPPSGSDAPPTVLGAAVFRSAQLDPATIYAYSPSQILAYRRLDARLDIDPFFDLRREIIGLRVTARWALCIPSPAAVVLIEGVNESS